MSVWTPALDDLLRRLYPSTPTPALLESFPGMSIGALRHRASRMGIVREIRWLSPETRAMFSISVATRRPRLGRGLRHPVVPRDGIEGKVCSECHEWRPLARFARHRECVGGVRGICTTCEGRVAHARYRVRRVAAVRRYQAAHADKHRLRKSAGEHRRRGRLLIGAGVAASDLAALRDLFNGHCAYCMSAEATTFDHVVPLARGGLHQIDNLLPACRPCNMTKNARTPEEWMTARLRAPRKDTSWARAS